MRGATSRESLHSFCSVRGASLGVLKTMAVALREQVVVQNIIYILCWNIDEVPNLEIFVQGERTAAAGFRGTDTI